MSLLQRMLEFASGTSCRVNEDVSHVNWLGEHWGEVGSAVKVVMVIMTFNGTPMGVSRRLSTGEIILFWVVEYWNCRGQRRHRH